MATLTIRMPDNKHNRLKALAQYRHISINKLVEKLSTQALADVDSQVRFRALAAHGNVANGLELLNKFDDHFSKG